ncbi:CATRA conflict system CASPASE/TPR repeat-associated protein [Polymorphospora lycopeni]|uniref:CATRA conflict system CASPASE/TPR repeat-associated protein n=1 Tax=Polymorphospora lycopeni TaxID=3140240 RepID=A0ABV5CVJ6_9ACTN
MTDQGLPDRTELDGLLTPPPEDVRDRILEFPHRFGAAPRRHRWSTDPDGTPTDVELVVQGFLPVTGPDRHTALPWVHHVWRRCAEVAGMDQALAALPAAPPAALEDLPAGSRPAAACAGPGPGVRQALLYREHDLLCLSVVLAPDPPTGWEASERLWERLVDGAPVAAPTIGEARLFLATGEWPPTPRAAVTRSGFRVWEEPLPRRRRRRGAA